MAWVNDPIWTWLAICLIGVAVVAYALLVPMDNGE